jgi:hypothetical protein
LAGACRAAILDNALVGRNLADDFLLFQFLHVMDATAFRRHIVLVLLGGARIAFIVSFLLAGRIVASVRRLAILATAALPAAAVRHHRADLGTRDDPNGLLDFLGLANDLAALLATGTAAMGTAIRTAAHLHFLACRRRVAGFSGNHNAPCHPTEGQEYHSHSHLISP